MSLSGNTIWGSQLVIPFQESDVEFYQSDNTALIRRQLHSFLKHQIEEWHPDKIVVVERKGTAILRALKEWKEGPLAWPWNDVISSEAIDQVPPEYFKEKRILVFDDMMKTGRHINDLKQDLKTHDLWTPERDNIRFAVFAVHRDSSANLPDAWFYRELANEDYKQIRADIVKMLQKMGSLMLDTEHIEIRVRLKCSLIRFASALSRRAKAAIFTSSAQRTNVTVLYGDDEAHALPLETFPSGTDFSSIVKKCRVVHREANEYALIPIFFPSILPDLSGWPASVEDSAMLGSGIKNGRFSCFYGVGLLAALQVLHFVLKDLAVLDPSEYSISLPKPRAEADSLGGYSLDHLNVVFPSLDLTSLTQRIYKIAKEAEAQGSLFRKRKIKLHSPRLFTDEELGNDALLLLIIAFGQLIML